MFLDELSPDKKKTLEELMNVWLNYDFEEMESNFRFGFGDAGRGIMYLVANKLDIPEEKKEKFFKYLEWKKQKKERFIKQKLYEKLNYYDSQGYQIYYKDYGKTIPTLNIFIGTFDEKKGRIKIIDNIIVDKKYNNLIEEIKIKFSPFKQVEE